MSDRDGTRPKENTERKSRKEQYFHSLINMQRDICRCRCELHALLSICCAQLGAMFARLSAPQLLGQWTRVSASADVMNFGMTCRNRRPSICYCADADVFTALFGAAQSEPLLLLTPAHMHYGKPNIAQYRNVDGTAVYQMHQTKQTISLFCLLLVTTRKCGVCVTTQKDFPSIRAPMQSLVMHFNELRGTVADDSAVTDHRISKLNNNNFIERRVRRPAVRTGAGQRDGEKWE